MNFEKYFRHELAALRLEGRYRVFADLERQAGNFPRATYHGASGPRDVTVWCSNDYLGMGQNPEVVAAMHDALESCGAVRGARATLPGRTIIMFCSRKS